MLLVSNRRSSQEVYPSTRTHHCKPATYPYRCRSRTASAALRGSNPYRKHGKSDMHKSIALLPNLLVALALATGGGRQRGRKVVRLRSQRRRRMPSPSTPTSISIQSSPWM